MSEKAQMDYFRYQKKILRLVGLSHNQKESVWYNLYSFVFLFIVMTFPAYTTQSILLNLDNYDVLMELLVYFCCYIATLLKLTWWFSIRAKVGRNLERLQSGVFIPNKERGGEVEEQLINQCMIYCNGQSTILCLLTILNSLAANVGPLINRVSKDSTHWSLPFGPVSLFDITSSPNFDIVWSYQFIFVPLACLAYCTIDGFIGGIMAYLSFQCKILQNFIKNSIVYSRQKMLQDTGTDKQDTLPLEVDRNHLKKTMKEIVEYHMDIIDLANEFEENFNVPNMINFLGLSIVICMAMFYTTSLPSFNSQCMQQVILALGCACLQLITAYWSNEVVVESLAIADACYEMDFVGLDLGFQKGLILVIQRAQKPIQFTVGKFAPLSLNTFVVVIKAAYSYYTLLHDQKDGKTLDA